MCLEDSPQAAHSTHIAAVAHGYLCDIEALNTRLLGSIRSWLSDQELLEAILAQAPHQVKNLHLSPRKSALGVNVNYKGFGHKCGLSKRG
jgi:hypothetical protein